MLEPTAVIGERLRKIRTHLNLSLDEAAKLTGVSKPMLGQIERGQSVPTVTTLWKIATGLKQPLSAFLQERRPEYVTVGVRGKAPITEDAGKMRAYPVFPFDPIRSVEVFLIEFDPDCHHPSEKHCNGVEEYILVLSGGLQLMIDGKEIILHTDEAIRFSADVPHEYHNPFPKGCTVYNIIFYPSK